MSSASAEVAPAARLQGWFTGVWVIQGLYVVCKLNIPDLLAAGPLTAAQLAETVQADPAFLYRLMRGLSAAEVFAEDAEQRFSLTPLSELLRNGAEGRNGAMFLGHPVHWQAWGQLLDAVRKGQDGFSLTQGLTVFETLGGGPAAQAFHQRHPDFGSLLMDTIGMHTLQGLEALRSIDFSGSTTVVDVGGGAGRTLAGLLKQHPHLRGILLDVPPMIGMAAGVLEQAGVKDRCQCEAGDFFQSVPAGGDVYLLQSILHNLPDDACVKVLGNCVRTMPPHGRLLVVDNVVPDIGVTADPSQQNPDLHMMIFVRGTRERRLAEFKHLFEAGGLRISRVVAPASDDVWDTVFEAIRA
jgi:ubiquinone/menaquinone biosynthesis C-methylase UbiE